MTNDLRFDREKVRDAFKALNKLGYRTRMNFGCCGGCASYELATWFDERNVPEADRKAGETHVGEAIEEMRAAVGLGEGDHEATVRWLRDREVTAHGPQAELAILVPAPAPSRSTRVDPACVHRAHRDGLELMAAHDGGRHGLG